MPYPLFLPGTLFCLLRAPKETPAPPSLPAQVQANVASHPPVHLFDSLSPLPSQGGPSFPGPSIQTLPHISHSSHHSQSHPFKMWWDNYLKNLLDPVLLYLDPPCLPFHLILNLKASRTFWRCPSSSLYICLRWHHSLKKKKFLFHIGWVGTVGGFLNGTSGKERSCQCRRHKRHRLDPWIRKIPWRRAWQRTPEFLPGESHGQRSLVGYSKAAKELDMTEMT